MFIERIKGITWVEIAVVAAIVLIVMVIAEVVWVRYFREDREVFWAIQCQENILMIEGAGDEWSVTNNKPDGTTVTLRSLVVQSAYLKKIPRCPGGGSYSQIFTFGATPTCDYTPPGWFDTRSDKYRHRVEGSRD